jgi:hypothetical protein
MNKPCSTTPGMAERRRASNSGSTIRSSAASRIQLPESVTKAWSSLSAAAARDRARRPMPQPPRLRGASRPARTARPPPQRISAEHRDPFQPIADHHQGGRCRGDDLLAQQGSAAALDQAQVGRDLVRPVDGELERGGFVQRGEGGCPAQPPVSQLPPSWRPRRPRGRPARAHPAPRRNSGSSSRCRAQAACPGARNQARARLRRVFALPRPSLPA